MTEVLLVGLATVDLVQRVEEFPRSGEKLQSLSMEVAAGGPAANAAVAIAALGGRPTLATVLGAHPLADLARADLSAHGVTVHDLLPDHDQPPAVSAISVRERDGERTVVSRNAISIDAPAEIPVVWCGAVLLDGHHPAPALRAARWAKETGVPVVLDAGSWKPVLDELLPLVDVAACSSAFQVPGSHDVEAALHARRVPVVIRTHGPNRVTWSGTECGFHYLQRSESRIQYVRGEVPVPRVAARDTLGAGDVWHGVFALGVARLGRVPGPEHLPGLIEVANEVAALRVRYEGSRKWVHELRKVER